MKIKVPSRILKLSVIISICTQSIFVQAPIHAEKQPTTHTWSIEEGSNYIAQSLNDDLNTINDESDWDLDEFDEHSLTEDVENDPYLEVYQSDDLSDIDWLLELDNPNPSSKKRTEPPKSLIRTPPPPSSSPSLYTTKQDAAIHNISTDEIAQATPENQKFITEPGETVSSNAPLLINFTNIGMVEYVRFIAQLSNKNFYFDEKDLQFNVTIISEEPTTIENVMTTLIQELRIRGLTLIEEGNNLIIHKNSDVRNISRVSVSGTPETTNRETELVTQVFRLNTLEASRAQAVLAPLLSTSAQIEISQETQQVIITDLVTNIEQVGILLKSIDSPESGMVIGQYVVRNTFMDNLIKLAQQVMEPIQAGQSLNFIPHPTAKSVFVVSSPFLVERTISVLQHLDSSEAATRIYNLNDLKYQESDGELGVPDGKWEVDDKGYWIFRPGFPKGESEEDGYYPKGRWVIDENGNWYFVPDGTIPSFIRMGRLPRDFDKLGKEQPTGRWTLEPEGTWVFQLSPGEGIQPKTIKRKVSNDDSLPIGHIDRTQFYIHKLQYRKGGDISDALQKIGDTLDQTGLANDDLVLTIQSAQWIETTNSIVFTGTETSIEKVKDLIEEIDRPTRQVFIEMLILETTIDDSLNYGVSWATRSGGGSTSTAQAYLGGASPLTGAFGGAGNSSGLANPDASTLATAVGYNLGIIGRRLTHNGTQFATLGALVSALHQRNNTNIVMNPKIIAEDNNPAEIFVGINTRFQTEAVSNDEGSIITNNFEFRDVGTTLRVTPMIGNNDIVSLEIEQEVSRVTGEDTGTAEGENISTVSPGPTTSINRTNTTVHIPDKHFVIISGMLNDERIVDRNQLPCLGGIPIIGGAFSDKNNQDVKRNLMIFIRPEIIDTGEEHTSLTKRQQEIFKQKNRNKKTWRYQVDEALDFLNVKKSCCDECD